MRGLPKDLISSKSVRILSLSWLLFVGIFFFLNWRPLNIIALQLPVIPQDVLASVVRLFLKGLPALVMLGTGVLAAIGAGGLILRFFRLRLDAGQSLTFSLALGLGFLSYLAFFTGILDGYNHVGRAVDLTVIAVAALTGAVWVMKTLRKAAPRQEPRRGKLLFFCLFVLVGLYLFSKALYPAVFFDAVSAHLGIPNYYIQEGGIKYIPYDMYSNFPFMAEMLYALGMFLSGLRLAQFTSVLVLLAATLAVYDFCRLCMEEINPAIPAIFFLLTPAFLLNSVLYTNDIHITYYTIMVVYCYFMWERTNEAGFIVLMGIFTGVCLGTKYTALPIVAFPAALACGHMAYREKDAGKKARVVIMFLAPAVAVYAPWFLRNIINTGNPLYPAFYSLFGGRDMDAALYNSRIWHPDWIDAARGLFEHPWRMFVAKPDYITNTYGVAAYLGPIILIFAPLMLVVKGASPSVKKLCLAAAVMFVSWNFAFNVVRYLYPAVIIMIIVSAYALSRSVRGAPVFFKAAMAGGAGFLLLCNLCVGFFLVDDFTAARGFEHINETDHEYLSRRMNIGNGPILAGVPVYDYINQNLSEGVRVLVIGDFQHLYLKRRHVCPSSLSGVTPFDVFKAHAGRPGEISAILKGEGITHIVYNPMEMRRLQRDIGLNFKEEDDPLIESFLKSGYARLILKSGLPDRPVYLFELT